MLAGNEKNLPKSLTREMLRFGNHFIHVERDPKNWIIARETAIPAIVDAFVGKIERSEQPHRASKILKRERTRSLRHYFKLSIRFRSDKKLEPLYELRFPQSQIVQGFDERHQNNFVRIPAFANADQRFALKRTNPSADWRPLLLGFTHVQKSGVRFSGRRCSKCYCRCLEGEVHAGADHAEVVMGPVHKVPAEVADPADMRGETHFHAAADLAHHA